MKIKGYKPEHGYKWQLLYKTKTTGKEYIHLGYASTLKAKKILLSEALPTLPDGTKIKSIILPKFYHPKN